MPRGKEVTVFEDGTDDFDGKPVKDSEAVNVYLAHGDKAWNIHLRPENAEKLSALIEKYTSTAEPAKSRGLVASGSLSKEERTALMAWSRQTDGVGAVAERGRVAEATLSKWAEAGKPGYENPS